jgi:hypothetical protein
MSQIGRRGIPSGLGAQNREPRRGLLIRNVLETVQEYHLALLLGNSGESAIEIAQ